MFITKYSALALRFAGLVGNEFQISFAQLDDFDLMGLTCLRDN